jgi:HAMP domain-containing protein
MWQAVLSLAGVVIGAAIAGGVALWQVQLVTAREREARRSEREQVRAEIREAFQRDSILALQEAVADLLRMAVGVLDDNVRQERETGQWPSRLHAADYPTGADELFARVERSRARVFDDELRQLALEVSNRFGLALSPTVTDFVTADGHFREIGEKRALLQQRVNTLLKGLF